MRYRLITLGVLVLFRVSGCNQHPLTDYRPLDQAGMWSSNVEQLKTLNTSDMEVAQLVKLKHAGIGDERPCDHQAEPGIAPGALRWRVTRRWRLLLVLLGADA